MSSKVKGPVLGLIFAVAFTMSSTVASGAGSVRVDRVEQQISEQSLDCKSAYPQISGITNIEAQKKLNVALMEKAKIFTASARYAAKSSPVKAGMDYKVTRNQGGVMSLVMKSGLDGGRGIKAAQSGVNIDTVTGRRLFLCDVFIDNADYVSTLSAQIKAQMTRGNPRLSKKFGKIREDADYYITGDSIVIFFSQGEYYSDAEAVREFAIPLRSLDGILRPRFTVNL